LLELIKETNKTR